MCQIKVDSLINNVLYSQFLFFFLFYFQFSSSLRSLKCLHSQSKSDLSKPILAYCEEHLYTQTHNRQNLISYCLMESSLKKKLFQRLKNVQNMQRLLTEVYLLQLLAMCTYTTHSFYFPSRLLAMLFLLKHELISISLNESSI